MALTPGTRLGHYDVTILIGEGGMGQVWQATDTQLNRQVALKILPDAFAADPDRLARFKREAQILASLNHPNIAAIYGIEEAEGTRALVLELAEGPTLADRIRKGPIPLDEALPIAKQIAEALEAAHEQGVIHRDLKPANVKVKADGTVKVLDFGLAKAFQPDASAPNMSVSPTISLTAAATQMGMVIGTAAYMSPEQARGKPVDKRTDIWAFGVVLFEMLTSAKAYPGDDVSQTLARVIDREPSWEPVPETVPPALSGYLRRCLEKDPKQRIQAIGDVRLALEGAFESVAVPTAVPIEDGGSRRPHATWLALTAVVAALVGGLAVWNLRPVPAIISEPVRFSIGATAGELIGTAPFTRQVVISQDGSYVVYTALNVDNQRPQLYVRRLDELEAAVLRGTELGRGPFASPDGEWVGFLDLGRMALKKVSILGGPPITVTEHASVILGASWEPDDRIIFGSLGGGLFRVSAAGGGTPEPLTTTEVEPGAAWHMEPSLIPGANAVLFVIAETTPVPANGQLAVLELDSGAVTRLGIAGFSPAYVSPGHVVYAVSDGSLRAVPFDADTLEVVGTPIPILEGVTVQPTGAADFSGSDAGHLVYFSGDSGLVSERTLMWVDREGRQEAIGVPPRSYTYARLSPDGTRIALDIRDQQNDIWVWDIAREALTRLTFDPGFKRGPVWTPDGTRIAFTAERDGEETAHWQNADGAGAMERLGPTDGQFLTSFSPDLSRFLFSQPLAPPYDLGVVTLGDERRTELLLETEFNETNGEFSLDGQWIAYESNESGRPEVYVRPFPGVDTAKHQISTGGGTRPLWSRDGSELYYYQDPDRIMVVAVDYEPDFSVGRPEAVVLGPYARPMNSGRHYDVTADGERFLLLADQRTVGGEETLREMTVVHCCPKRDRLASVTR